MKKKTRLFGAIFLSLVFLGFVWPVISFALDLAATAVASAIPVPQTGVWFLDLILSIVPAMTPVIVALLGGGKVWLFLFSISKPITMFTSTQLPNPANNQTIKMLNVVLLVMNYVSLNIFNDKNADHPVVARPVPEISSTLPKAA